MCVRCWTGESRAGAGNEMAVRGKELASLQQSMGVAFSDLSLLRSALTHTSYLNEHPDCQWTDNERLEYLGDAVVGIVTSEFLYRQYPELPEGELTRLRAELVRSDTLALFAARLGLGSLLLMGKGEEQSGGRERASALADAFEALLAALYLDQGLEASRRFLLPLLRAHLSSSADRALARDAKTRLQEWAQSVSHQTPTYQVLSEDGPDHAKQFTVEVQVAGMVQARGTGASKQEAEQAAAQGALEEMTSRPAEDGM